MKFFPLSLLLFLSFTSQEQVKTIYNSLDPLSISEHLAFYHLYPQTPEGQKAQETLYQLLGVDGAYIENEVIKESFESLIGLVNKPNLSLRKPLPKDTLNKLEAIGRNLKNRQLKGKYATSETEVLALDPSEIDLARGLFLSQLGSSEMDQIRTYEVSLDLMAIQILNRLSPNSSVQEKVNAMNQYIFYELGFRFPPHSLYAKNVDLYTFLSSVLDSRRGVCLGVSILYITLAQRIGLDLEMVTPPGHIYVRARDKGKIINIETTARGVNPDSSIYLGMDTKALETITIKEVIGTAHYNQASTFWHQERHDLAIESYEKAKKYMPNHKQLIELMGYNYLFNGEIEKGKACLEEVRDYKCPYTVSPSTIPSDYLDSLVDVEGLKAVLQPVDENRSSILKKRDAIIASLKKNPEFKEGWNQLAVCYLQLHRMKEALEALKKSHELFEKDVNTEYYLTVLYAERQNYKKAWEHFYNLEKILKEQNHEPRALKELKRELTSRYTSCEGAEEIRL
ncbi:MAG: transglutaminase family protein [Parachlamydiaceae bacterium]